ncbi:hypothetical protein MXB_807 [Myxobolus squamalis]|nr:hypothetical protein MXB_807 [Myxobolus squamalis]
MQKCWQHLIKFALHACVPQMVSEFVDAIAQKYCLSIEELNYILRNFKEYITDFKIADINSIFSDKSTDNKKFKIDINFKELLSNGITSRSKNQVYMKAYYMHHKSESPKKLQSSNTSDWLTIGSELGRSALECSTKFRSLHVTNGQRKVGPWTEKESRRMRKAIRRIMKIPKRTFALYVLLESQFTPSPNSLADVMRSTMKRYAGVLPKPGTSIKGNKQ